MSGRGNKKTQIWGHFEDFEHFEDFKHLHLNILKEKSIISFLVCSFYLEVV